jgi:hypothetical protein
VREQREVVGHAVRAVYLYSAMADLAGDYGDASEIVMKPSHSRDRGLGTIMGESAHRVATI